MCAPVGWGWGWGWGAKCSITLCICSSMQYAGSSQEKGVNSSIDCPCHYPCNPTVLLSQPAAAPKVPECAPAATVAAVQRKCTTYTLVELMLNHCSFPAPHCAHTPSPLPPPTHRPRRVPSRCCCSTSSRLRRGGCCQTQSTHTSTQSGTWRNRWQWMVSSRAMIYLYIIVIFIYHCHICI